MADAQKAEELWLPEQLHILSTDHETGEPQLDRAKTERMLALSILWELVQSGALTMTGNTITSANQVLFKESYMRHAALLANSKAPVEGARLVVAISTEMRPIWSVIGADMVDKRLLEASVQTRLLLIHKRVLKQTAEARRISAELTTNLLEQVARFGDPSYQAEFAGKYPRLLARIVLMENYGLLSPIAGPLAYQQIEPHIPWLKQYLNDMIMQASAAKPTEPLPSDPTYGPDFSSFFLSDTYDDGNAHSYGGHEHGHCHGHDHDNDNSDSGDSGGGDSGGGGDGGGGGD